MSNRVVSSVEVAVNGRQCQLHNARQDVQQSQVNYAEVSGCNEPGAAITYSHVS